MIWFSISSSSSHILIFVACILIHHSCLYASQSLYNRVTVYDYLLELYRYRYYIDIGTDITSIGIGQLQVYSTDTSIEYCKY